MSHPPETSLTSRELAKTIIEDYQYVSSDTGFLEADYEQIAALIEAWVRVREAEAVSHQHKLNHGCKHTGVGGWYGYNCPVLAKIECALAAARKQLEEKKGESA